LSEREKATLSDHFEQLIADLMKTGSYPFPARIVPTTMSKEDGEKLIYTDKIFNLLSSSKDSLTEPDITERLKGSNPEVIASSLSLLEEVGAIERDLPIEAEKSAAYKVPASKGDDILEIENALDSYNILTEKGFKKAKGKILKVTQPRWAHSFLDFALESPHAARLQERKEKTILVLETDWIPEDQRGYIQQLVQEFNRINGKGPIEIVRTSSKDLTTQLEGKIKEAQKGGKGRDEILKNVVVLASRKTVEENTLLKQINGKAFIAGIDNSQLNENSYIRLLEMATMALRCAYGQKPISSHPNIGIEYVEGSNMRTVIFLPKAEPVEVEDLKEIYKLQLKLLAAA
jgi:hypothetical protein